MSNELPKFEKHFTKNSESSRLFSNVKSRLFREKSSEIFNVSALQLIKSFLSVTFNPFITFSEKIICF